MKREGTLYWSGSLVMTAGAGEEDVLWQKGLNPRPQTTTHIDALDLGLQHSLLKVTGDSANNFTIKLYVKVHPDDDWTLLPEADVLEGANTLLVGANETKYLRFDLTAYYYFKIVGVQDAADTGTLTMYLNAMSASQDGFTRSYSALLEADVVTVTSTSSTLATLGLTIDPSVKEIMLVPTDTMYYNNGTASASTNLMPSSGITLAVSKALIDTLQFYAGSNTVLSVTQFG
jgi:hypothetical protein